MCRSQKECSADVVCSFAFEGHCSFTLSVVLCASNSCPRQSAVGGMIYRFLPDFLRENLLFSYNAHAL